MLKGRLYVSCKIEDSTARRYREFNDLKDTVKSILSRIEAVEEHVRARNPSEQITTIKDLLRRVEAIEQHIRQHHPNDMK
jgi:hypothetical protein